MKLLVVSQYFYPENFKFNDLVTDLALDNEVIVLTGIPNYPHGSFFKGYSLFSPVCEHYNGAKIYRCPLIPRGKSKIMLALNYASFAIFASIFVFYFILFQKKFDKVLVCQLSPISLALPAVVYRFFTKVPVALWITDLWPESLSATNTIHNKSILRMVELFVIFIYKNVDKLLISCRGFAQSIKDKVSSADIEYFPYWAEDYYKVIPPNPDFKFANEFKILFAGNLGEAQNLNLLVEVAKRFEKSQKIKFIIVGEGRAKESLQTNIAKHKLEPFFEFIGAYPPEMMAGIFAHADMLYISLREDPIFEITVPSKLQSYMACAKPILASIDGEAADLITEAGCGLVSKANYVEGLYQNILSALNMSKDDLVALGQNANEYYKKYFRRDIQMANIRKILKKAEYVR